MQKKIHLLISLLLPVRRNSNAGCNWKDLLRSILRYVPVQKSERKSSLQIIFVSKVVGGTRKAQNNHISDELFIG